MALITSKDKDRVLNHLVENYQIGRRIAVLRDTEIEGYHGDELEGILKQFVRRGLIELDAEALAVSYYSINIESHDFVNNGGFYGQEELFQLNAEGLLREIEKLKAHPQPKSVLDNMDSITSILGNMATFAGLLLKN